MKKLLLGLVLSLLSVSSVFAIDGLKVDGLHGVQTQAAAQKYPELAKQYNIGSSMACTGGGGTTNCGASQQNVADFQAAVMGQEAGGSGGGGGLYQVKLQEPLEGGQTTLAAANGVDLINQYLSMIYMWAASIIGLIAVLMIVVSGIQIIFGGASPELVSDAKTRVVQSLLSLILLFCTALLLKTVNPTFFAYF